MLDLDVTTLWGWLCTSIVTGAIQIMSAYVAVLVCYRLFFHPLRSIPGPKLAAATYWYEFFYEVLSAPGGQYSRKIQRMHQAYGPIVRITPNEIHVDDPDWYDVYTGQRDHQARDKYEPVTKMSGTTSGMFATANHQKHRIRRNAISFFFSKQSIRAIEPIITSRIVTFCEFLQRQANDSESGTVELLTAFLAFGTDITCTYVLGASPHGNILQDASKQKQWRDTIYSLEDLTPIAKQFPWCIPLARSIPLKFLDWLWPDLSRLLRMHQSMARVARDMISKEEKQQSGQQNPTNVFQAILHSQLSPHEKSEQRLADEGFDLLAAGGETVARATAAAFYHLLSHPTALFKVREELQRAPGLNPGELSLQTLESLSFLTAVIKESLRLSAVISTRLPLVSPQDVVCYKHFNIPAGYPISMSPSNILHDPRCYEDPLTFTPERWLQVSDDSGEASLSLTANKYFLAFSRGSRGCLGINLAYAEIYLLMAGLLTRFDFELYETIRERDIDHARDCFVGKPDRSSQGVRVKLTPRTEV